MKKFALLLALVSCFAVASFAAATPTLSLYETFQSGATFTGTVTFTDPAYSNLIGVSGWLTGGGYGNDYINWIWNPSFNYASSFGPQYGGNFLMDGTTCGAQCGSYLYFITITWDTSSGFPVIATPASDILSNFGGNNIIYVDPLVSGHFAPEPGTFVMLGSGVLGLAGLLRRKLAV